MATTTLAMTVVVGGGKSLSNGWDLGLVVLACAAYVVLITRPVAGLTIRMISVAVAVQTIVAVARPPSATEDLWWYAIYGRIFAVYHASPYTHVAAQFPHNPLLALVGHSWRHTPSVYGPLFTALSGAATLAVGSSTLATRLFYQGLAAAALVAVCVLVWRRTRSAGAVAFVGLNPVTSLYLVNGGRNDILVGLALLGAVLLVERERPVAAGVVGGLGALVKLTGALGVVALVVALVVGKRTALGRRVGFAAFLTVAGAYVVAGVRALFTPMNTAGSLYSRESVWRLLGVANVTLPATTVALVVLGVLVCWVMVWSARRGPAVAVPAAMTALSLGASYTLPSYVGWSLPTAALNHREPLSRLIAYQAVLLVVGYEIVRHPLPGELGHLLRQTAIIGGPLIVLLLLARLLWSLHASGGRGGTVPPRVALALPSVRPVTHALVVVPTLDERDNVEAVLRGIRAAAPSVDVLVVDDDSPDGTADVATAVGREIGSVVVMRRRGEPGLGAAYRDGFAFALSQGYDAVVEMDADLSHDPAAIPSLLDALAAGADLAIGARYVSGGATPGWPWRRRVLSRLGGGYARVVLGLPARDPTSGFRAFRAGLLRRSQFPSVAANGFAFQVEMLHRAKALGAQVVEVPIVFRDRTAGVSKLTSGIAGEAFRLVLELRRHPWRPRSADDRRAGAVPGPASTLTA